MKRIDRLLIANRGEIACRIIRTAQRMGIETVAVHSQADKDELPAALADRSINIGADAPVSSYLDVGAIIEAALRTDATAIHPGYGFLSENPDLASACEDAGLVFVGPPAGAIDLMGNKAKAKNRMSKAGVPCVAGYHDNDQSMEALTRAAERTGYPLLVKAAAGGGGRGMRIVRSQKEFPGALEEARAESQAAFQCDEIILEKLIDEARHIEVQILADRHGQVLHLGERECSIQRRYQKIIEECPSPAVGEELRKSMGAVAVKAAKAIGYQNAGTVEFLLSPDESFYFLEMNTRLQVEHPVTEMVTGLDLVEWQIRIAQGEKLPFSQDDIRHSGHAIEARLYAENASDGFLPSVGKVARWVPAELPGIRIDNGIADGSTITAFYDPLVAKIISHCEDRETARRRLLDGLVQTTLLGVISNKDFLIDLVQSPAFRDGCTTTDYADGYIQEKIAPLPEDLEPIAIAAALLYRAERDRAIAKSIDIPGALIGWSSNGGLTSHFSLSVNGKPFNVQVFSQPDAIEVRIGDGTMKRFRIHFNRGIKNCVETDGRKVRALGAFVDSMVFDADVEGKPVRLCKRSHIDDEEQADGMIAARTHGKIVEILVREGSPVRQGDHVATLEAMKMQYRIVAPVDGIVSAIDRSNGEQVKAGDRLIQIEPASASAKGRIRG